MNLHVLNLSSTSWLAFLPDTPGALPFGLSPGHSQHTLAVNEGTYLVFGPDAGYAEQLPRPFNADESSTTAGIVILPDGTSTSIITNPPDK